VQSGRIEAQENPLTTLYNFGLHIYHRHITLTGHLFGVAVVLCHQASYTAWPAEVQQALTEAVAEATSVQRRLAMEADDEVLARLHPAHNEVVRLTDAARALFVEAVTPLVDEQRQVFGNKGHAVFRSSLFTPAE
jgi:TRAP-type C4-dicarboxylate transport system substrate-binding protein